MPDQNLPQPPSDSTLKAIIKDLWSRYSIFFIIVGALLLIAKFGDIAMDILGYKSKKLLENAQKTDTALKAQEDAANKQANDLIAKADNLPKTEEIVDEDWNKKKGN